MSSSEATFSADALDRNIGPTGPTAAERRGLALALIAAAALHAAVPLALFAYYALWPVAPVPVVQEIPVEVVVEPPLKPDKPEEKPKPPPQPEDEKPAYDAPRAATQEKVNRNSSDDKTQAPAARAEPPLNPGAPQKAESQAPAQEQKTANAPPLIDLKPTQEADQPAAPAAPSTDADASPEAEKAEPNAAPRTAPQPPAEAPVGAPLPTIEALPQYKFARTAKDSPTVGGNAESRYFTILYGMIRSHLREPSGPHAVRPSREGAVVFAVDESGNLLARKLVNSSGSPSLDMAVMTAIAEAAPFPAPPNWQPKYLRLTYGR